MESHPIILFDGVCNLCNASVNYVIDHDADGLFWFGSLQSVEAQAVLARHRIPEGFLDSIVLVEGQAAYIGSTAALRIARRLRGPARLLWPLIAVPRPVRDAVYRFIAARRYAWFGRQDVCRIPTPELRSRFIDAAAVSPPSPVS